MPLIDFILSMEPLGAIGFSSVFLGLILVFVLIIYMSAISPLFAKRLDPILFNQRWFTVFELGFYNTWPFSLMKILYYVFFITFPKFSRRKRFKDIPTDLDIPLNMIVLSQICLILYFLTLIASITFAVTGFYSYFFYEAPANSIQPAP